MARTIPGGASTEIAKVNGAEIIRVMEIEWGGSYGTVYLSDRALTTPVSAAAKVRSWGSIVVEAQADQVGGYGNASIELIDTDYSLKDMFDDEPGPAAKPVKIYEYFAGTTWSTDKVTIFSGLISGDVEFDASTAIWRLSLKGLEKLYDKSLGVPLTRENFPTIRCTDHEGKIIPIVYGQGVKRVPGRLIAMPGHAYLAEPLFEHDTTATLSQTCEELGITAEETVTLTLGTADLWETITGSFASAGTNVFDITGRGSILASGQSPGTYGSNGGRYFTIDRDDLPENTGSLIGYPIWIDEGSGYGGARVIDNWISSGEDTIAVVREAVGETFTVGANWKIGSIPGLIIRWPVSTPAYGPGGWVYAVSHLPSAEVQSVQVRAQLKASGGSRGGWAYYLLNPDRYTVELDNKDYNEELGRAEEDDGITTITLTDPPITHGFDDAIFATLDGPGSYNTPDTVLNHILTHEYLGNVPAGNVNLNSSSAVELAFAITEEVNLHDVVSQLAFQGCCLYFWDQGVAQLRSLSNTLGSATSTLTVSNVMERSLTLGHADLEAAYTSALAKFKPTCVSSEVKFYRKSTTAEGHYGERRKELDLWGIQDPEQIVDVLEFWLGYYLNQQRTLKVECFLDQGLKLQPGDVVSVSFADGNGNALLTSQKARVTRVEHILGDPQSQTMERIKVEGEFAVWSFAIDDASPDLELCQGEGGDELELPNDSGTDGSGGISGWYGDGFGGTTLWVKFNYSSTPPEGPGGETGEPVNPNVSFGICKEIEFVTEVGHCEYKTTKERVFLCEPEEEGSGSE